MAESGKESKGSVFSRGALFTKKISSRATEKVLQRFGKSAATKDETFSEFVTNFTKQQTMATRLQKELKKYTDALKTMESASRAMGDTFRELFEPDWAGRDEVCGALDSINGVWSELLGKLKDQLIAPMGTYTSHFPEIRAKISKHERKVVDYDRHRRHLEQAKKAKGKGSEAKLAQAEAEFEEARRIYDDLTNELYEEIPTFYDSRIPFYAAIFQSLYVAEASYHMDTATIKTKLNDLMDGVAQEAATHVHSTRKVRQLEQDPEPVSTTTTTTDETTEETTEIVEPEKETSTEEKLDTHTSDDDSNSDVGDKGEGAVQLDEGGAEEVEKNSETSQETGEGGGEESAKNESGEADVDGADAPIRRSHSPSGKQGPPKPVRRSIGSPAREKNDDVGGEEGRRDADEGGDTMLPGNASKDAETPAGEILYQVVSTHPYAGQDEDELSFEKGVTIDVVPFEDDDEDEGWLKGVNTTNGKIGLFPANFTKKI